MGFCPKLSTVDKKGKLVKIECQKHDCDWYIQAQGTHPQTGETISEFDCNQNWQSVFLIENARRLIQMSASIDSSRNETLKHQDALLQATQTDKEAIRRLLVQSQSIPGKVEVIKDE